MSTLARIAAAIVAIVAWVGLGTQLAASTALVDGNVPAAIWSMVFYFTVIANLLVAVAFSWMAITGRQAPAFWLGGLVVVIVLVGVVYNTVLQGLVELSGGALLADFLNHTLTPILVPIWWLAFARKGGLRWRDPWLWAILPLAYFVYGILRAPGAGRYPYPFMDVGALGWVQVGVNAVLIAVGFIVAGYVVVGVDRVMGRRGQGEEATPCPHSYLRTMSFPRIQTGFLDGRKLTAIFWLSKLEDAVGPYLAILVQRVKFLANKP